MFQRVLRTPLQQFISNFCNMGFRHNFPSITSGISNEDVKLNIESWKTMVETYEKSVPLIDPDQFLREVNNKVYKGFTESISRYTNGNNFVKEYIKEVCIFIILQNGRNVRLSYCECTTQYNRQVHTLQLSRFYRVSYDFTVSVAVSRMRLSRQFQVCLLFFGFFFTKRFCVHKKHQNAKQATFILLEVCARELFALVV